MKVAFFVLALLGVAFAKRQVILSPPPVGPSPPPPSPPPQSPGAPPAPAPTTFPTPGFLWSLVIPGYTQASFGSTQQSQVCDLLINRDVQEIAIENCQISTIATYNGSNVQVSGYTYWGWKRIPSVQEVNTANALRDYAILQLKTNASALFAPTFNGVYPNCACEDMTEVTRSGNLNFVYKNITIVPASADGPAQCGAKLSYDSTVASNVINQVGVESTLGPNFGQFCAPGGVAGGVVGTPGVGSCKQYGVIAQASDATKATAVSEPTVNGQYPGSWNGVASLVGGTGYTAVPKVTISAPTPVAITPTFTLNSKLQLTEPSFAAENGPYTTAPAVTVDSVCFQCTSTDCTSGGYTGNATCTGTSQSLQIGSGTYSGPTCTSSEFKALSSNTVVTGFTVGGVVIGSSDANNVICTVAPTMAVSSTDLQQGVTAVATATVSGGVVTAIQIVTRGSGYLYGKTPTITIEAPFSNDIGKLCSPTPIAGLSSSIAVSGAVTITTTGRCQPLGIDTYSRKVCSVPAVVNGLSNWNKLGVQTCDTVSSFKAQPNAPTSDSCLLLPQTFITTAISPAPPASPPAVPPATPPSPTPLVCSYRGTYEITPLYGPCDKYYIASGTDDNCSNNLVNLRTKSNLGDKLNRIRWTFASESKGSLGTPTNVLANARTGCTNKYLAAPSDGTNLKVGGAAWKWQFVPYPGGSKCDEVNMISQNRLSTTAFLQIPRTCDRFRYNATDGGRQRFRLRKV